MLCSLVSGMGEDGTHFHSIYSSHLEVNKKTSKEL
uniref:Uncharacterized protein n=1 Tax=Ciona intestinalis TaxID=7719 RepID=H2XPN0_CIOIN